MISSKAASSQAGSVSQYAAWSLNTRLDGRPKASIAIRHGQIPKLCRKRAARREQGFGALRVEAASIPKYRTLPISKGPNRNTPCRRPRDIGDCEQANSFMRASATQSSRKASRPALQLLIRCPESSSSNKFLFSRGVLLHRHQNGRWSLADIKGATRAKQKHTHTHTQRQRPLQRRVQVKARADASFLSAVIAPRPQRPRRKGPGMY